MARTDFTSASWTAVAPRRWRLLLVVFFVRMWRLNAWPRLMEPLPRTRKRLDALFLVFILGMTASCFVYMLTGVDRTCRACRPAHTCFTCPASCRAPKARLWD